MSGAHTAALILSPASTRIGLASESEPQENMHSINKFKVNEDSAPLLSLVSDNSADIPVNVAYVRGQAILNIPDPEGLANTKSYHLNSWTLSRGAAFAHLTAEQAHHTERLKQLTPAEAELVSELRHIPRYIDESLADGVKVLSLSRRLASIFVATLAVGSLGLDVFACATVLQNSGSAAFVDSPWKAWISSSSPIILSLVGKALVGMAGPGVRKFLVFSCGTIAFGAALAWAWLFATTFPALNQNLNEILGSFDQAGAGTSATHSGLPAQLLVLLQIVAGSMGGICLLEFAAHLRAGHQLVRRKANPQYDTTAVALRGVRREMSDSLSRVTRAKGQISSMEAERETLLLGATNVYQLMRHALASHSKGRPA